LAAVARLFIWTRKRPVPVVHEPVRLSPEGAKVWEQVADPNSPVGKPVHHRRRRMADGDAAP
jgi:hypothetical protein